MRLEVPVGIRGPVAESPTNPESDEPLPPLRATVPPCRERGDGIVLALRG